MTAILTKQPDLGKACVAPEKAKCKMRLVLVSSGHIMALLMNAKTCGGMIIPHICMTLSHTQFLFCYQNTELAVQCIGSILQWRKLRFICVKCGVCIELPETSQRWGSLQTPRVLLRWAGWKDQRMKNKSQLSKCFMHFEMTSKGWFLSKDVPFSSLKISRT